MKEKGELDTEIYQKIKAEKEMIKKQDCYSKDFPSKADTVKYPEAGIKTTNPLFQTSNGGYGTSKPTEHDIPSIQCV